MSPTSTSIRSERPASSTYSRARGSTAAMSKMVACSPGFAPQSAMESAPLPPPTSSRLFTPARSTNSATPAAGRSETLCIAAVKARARSGSASCASHGSASP